MAAKTVNGWSKAVTKPEQGTKQLKYHEWLGEESDIVQLTPCRGDMYRNRLNAVHHLGMFRLPLIIPRGRVYRFQCRACAVHTVQRMSGEGIAHRCSIKQLG
jgi:hypothetical protein